MSRRVLIIGGGVIGLTTAYYCARRGDRVTVLERHPAQRDGCSFGNAGMIVPSHFVPLAAPGMVALGLKWMGHPESPFYIQPRLSWDLLNWGMKFWRAANEAHVRRAAPLLRDLSFASRDCFEELTALPGGDFGLNQRGLLMLCAEAETLDEEAKLAARANELGIPAHVLTPADAAAVAPEVRMNIAGAIHFPKDCHLTPQRFMATIQAQCDTLGVEFHWRAEVTGLAREGAKIGAVTTSSGEFSADEIVLCAGAWSSGLARELGLKLPMQAGKGYSLTLPSPRHLPRICAILAEARVAVTPMDGALRFGGTMELSGLSEQINPRRVQGIIKAVPRYYPDFSPADFAGIQPWCGLRPCSPDGLPYLGRTRAFSNLTIATGHAMMGLSLGPISGRIISELLHDEAPLHDLRLLSPDRYA